MQARYPRDTPGTDLAVASQFVLDTRSPLWSIWNFYLKQIKPRCLGRPILLRRYSLDTMPQAVDATGRKYRFWRNLALIALDSCFPNFS